MINITDKEKCNACTACTSICVRGCITMHEDNEGFLYPKVDQSLCNNCGLCEIVCPIIHQRPSVPISNLDIYACYNKNDEIRRLSSSGGIFTLLSEKVLVEGGVVFGSCFDHNFSVKHDFTENNHELEIFRGSKYLQSRIEDNYQKTEKFLKEGRKVLFSGTPCQIAGLKNYLRKDYKNLITVDFACHGVPSPKVFRIYLEQSFLKNKNEKIKDIKFRDKSEGWKKFNFAITMQDKNKYCRTIKERLDTNVYMKGFLNNLYLRPSCYVCQVKSFSSGSDITIADFWGIEKIHPEMDDDKGTSLAIINTEEGREFFNIIKESLCLIPSSLNKAVQYNPCLVKPVVYNTKRDVFFKNFETQNINLLINKLTKIKFNKQLKYFILHTLYKTRLIIKLR